MGYTYVCVSVSQSIFSLLKLVINGEKPLSHMTKPIFNNPLSLYYLKINKSVSNFWSNNALIRVKYGKLIVGGRKNFKLRLQNGRVRIEDFFLILLRFVHDNHDKIETNMEASKSKPKIILICNMVLKK